MASPATSPGGPTNLDVTFREALRVWVRVGLQSFGGPAGQIAVMHRILVEEKQWLSESRFLHALNYCMLLPGPEAQQLAIYSGWLLHGYRGGLVAGWLFVLPGFLSILALSIVYAWYPDTAAVAGLFFGLQAAVLAVVAEAVLRIGRRALKRPLHRYVAAGAFLAIFFGTVPFPFVILAAALVGLVEARSAGAGSAGSLPEEPTEEAGGAQRPQQDTSLLRSVRVAALWGGLWLAPTAAITLTLGLTSIWSQLARFFSQAAVVTFGGAYSVLAYIAQEAVESHAWLEPGEMLTGLGMAETTPGPLIQIVQYVGFMGAYRDPGGLDPLLAGVLAAILVTWVTFAPCFLWIFLGAPYMERLRSARMLNAALSMITAAVVGTVLNLAVWFALHTLFADVEEHRSFGVRLLIPQIESFDVAALGIGSLAALALFRFKVSVMRILVVAALAGVAYEVTLA